MRAAPSFHSRSRRDALEQLVGGAVAIARAPSARRRGRSRASMVVGIGGDPRSRARPSRRPARPRPAPAPSGRGRSPGPCRPSPAGRRASRAPRRSRRRRSARGRGRKSTSGFSGAISTICWKMLAARSPSPSASTCSPIAISGSISASRCCASPWTGSWARIWSSAPVSWPSVRAEVRSATGWPWKQRIDGRDRLDAELGGDELLLVDIDLDQLDAAVGIIGGDLLEHRRQLLAGPAPFRPEIEDDERGHARLDDVAPEFLDRLALGLAQSQCRHFTCLRTASYLRPMWDGGPVCQARMIRGLAGPQRPMLAAAALPGPVTRPLAQSGRSSGVEHNLAKVGVEGSNPFARSSSPSSVVEPSSPLWRSAPRGCAWFESLRPLQFSIVGCRTRALWRFALKACARGVHG